jgi:transposase-like protein
LIVPKPSQNLETKVGSQTGDSESDPALSGARLESVSGARRRVFTAPEKLRILKEADVALASGTRGAVEALLRKRGIYSSQLSKWRTQLSARGAAGLTAKQPGRKAKFTESERRMAVLEKRNAVLERQLHITTALLALQKKAYALMNLALPESDETS